MEHSETTSALNKADDRGNSNKTLKIKIHGHLTMELGNNPPGVQNRRITQFLRNG